MENILKFLFPPKCIFCGGIGDIFCDNCLGNCSLLQEQYCVVCDRPSKEGFTHERCLASLKGRAPIRMVCIYSYLGTVRDCIKFSKYGARQFMSFKKLCGEAATICKESYEAVGADVCLPIPSSPGKLRFRGFNQANMVAEEFSKRFGVPIKKDVLIRCRNTESQYTKNKVGRSANVANSFKVSDAGQVRGKKIVVVDDISTTGATFLESSRILYEAGAHEVLCFAVSKREKFCYNVEAVGGLAER